MKGDISFSILSKEDGIHFIHEKNFNLQVDVHGRPRHTVSSQRIKSVKERRRAVKIWGLTVFQHSFPLCCVHCVKSSVHQYLQQKSIVNKLSRCFDLLGTKWTRHQRTKQITTQRITHKESEKTRLTFATYLLLLNPHSLWQVEVLTG